MRNNCDITKERESLFDELEHIGFEPKTIIQALSWLANLNLDHQKPPRSAGQNAFRVYSEYECELIDPACQNYIFELEKMGILDFETREMLIHQIMDLREEGIDLALVKWVALLVLFNQPKAEKALAQMELLVLEQAVGGLH
jgi:Smg protein